MMALVNRSEAEASETSKWADYCLGIHRTRDDDAEDTTTYNSQLMMERSLHVMVLYTNLEVTILARNG